MKVKIGITSGTEKGKELIEHWPITFASRHVVEKIEEAGGIPIILPVVHNTSIIPEMMEGLDGIVATGEMISADPSIFKEHADNVLEMSNPYRYQTESVIVQTALQMGIPIIGFCRGYQVLNVVSGGSMKDGDITVNNPVIHRQKDPPQQSSHSIRIDQDSRLYRILKTSEIPVNSFHRQAVERVSPEFKIVATSPDGSVEAIEAVDDDRFIIGMQFHPEMMEEDEWKVLFREFVQAAEQRKRQ